MLLNADLVIADVTTLNANAVYELGVRHAAKPYSTIIMIQSDNEMPFDLNHCRIIRYDEITGESNEKEIARVKEDLKKYVLTCDKKEVDSPLYTYYPNINPPTISDGKYTEIIKKTQQNNEKIYGQYSDARKYMSISDFESAKEKWSVLKKTLPNDEYVNQQLALSIYKSKLRNETMALDEALSVIKTLNPRKSLNIETIGLTGAIYKNLYHLNKNLDYLNESIFYYRKGYVIKEDYYNGENYANCMMLKSNNTKISNEEKSYLKAHSKVIYSEVIEIIISGNDISDMKEDIWKFATLSICYLVIGDTRKHLKYKDFFYSKCEEQWKIDSFKDTVKECIA